MKTRKAVTYARYSSDKQQESSIIVQLREIHKYAKENGFEIIEDYVDEAQSGTTANRTDFQRMIRKSSEGEFNFIIVHRMDRWARNVEDAMHYKRLLNEFGVTVISVIEDFEDSPEGDFFSLISMGMAELYSKRLARECVNGQLLNARMGNAHGGTVPLGYSVKNKKYVLNKKEAEVVRYIFDMVADGKSYSFIRNTLNSQGYTYRGKPFTIHFHEMLKNRKYIGEYVYNRSSKRKQDGSRNNHSDKAESEIIRIPDGMPRIVTNEVFDKVQEIMKEREYKKGRMNQRGKNLLSGLLVCKNCGTAYSGGYRAERCGQNLVNRYYCNSKKDVTKCKNKPVEVCKLDAYIYELIMQVFLLEANAVTLINIIKKAMDNNHDKRISMVRKLNKKIYDMENNITEMQETKERSISTRSKQLIGDAIDGSTKELSALQTEIDKLYTADEYIISLYITRIRNHMRQKSDVLRYREKESMKDTLRSIVEKIAVSNTTIETTIKLNFYVPDYPIGLYITVIEERDNIALLKYQDKRRLSLENVVLRF
ncbi:MAG: recombinase family protein [Bacillota bacterium]